MLATLLRFFAAKVTILRNPFERLVRSPFAFSKNYTVTAAIKRPTTNNKPQTEHRYFLINFNPAKFKQKLGERNYLT